MISVRAVTKELMDSPSLLTERATLFSAWRLGLWYLVLNVLIGMVLLVAIPLALSSAGIDRITATIGLGQYVACLVFCTIAFCLTILVPIRAAGIFAGPRWGRYFDQVVLSGISPSRYLAGKVIGMNQFFAVLMFGTLPYWILCLALGGTTPLFVVGGILGLWLYANVLTMLTLAAGLYCWEVVGAMGVIFIFLNLFWIGLTPAPVAISLFAPTRVFCAPLYTALDQTELAHLIIPWFNSAVPIPAAALFLAGSCAIVFCLSLLLLIGPLYCLGQVNSTFGAVVMKGDTRRRSWFPRHLGLQRRAEICFFYENRSDRLARWEIPIRWGAMLFLLFAVIGTTFALLHIAAPQIRDEEFFLLNWLLAGLLLWLAGALFTNDTGTERTWVRWGKRRFRAGAVDTRAFFVSALVILVMCFALPYIREIYTVGNWFRGRSDDLAFRALAGAPLAVLCATQYYALARALSMAGWSRGLGVFLATVLHLVLLVFGPAGLGIILAEVPPQYGGLDALAYIGAVIAYISPIPHIATIIAQDAPDSIEALFIPGSILTYAIHITLTVVLVAWAVRAHRRNDPWGDGR